MTSDFSNASCSRTRPRRRALLAAAILTISIPLAACSSGTPSPSSADGATVIQMTDQLTFSPAEITVPVGTTVRWDNVSAIVHTATDDPAKAADAANAKLPDGAQPWDSGDIAAGGSWEYTFTVPGEYVYNCTPHEAAGMVGRITVTGS